METASITVPGHSFVPSVQPPEPFTLVIFGATGDLTARKLLPALFSLTEHQYLPSHYAIVGVGRRPKTDEEFRQEAIAASGAAGMRRTKPC